MGGAGARVVTHAAAGVRAPAERRTSVRVRQWGGRQPGCPGSLRSRGRK